MDTKKIKSLLYLETIITSLIHHEVEELLRGKEIDNQKMIDSIVYHLEDKL